MPRTLSLILVLVLGASNLLAEGLGKVISVDGQPTALRGLKKVVLTLGAEIRQGDRLKTGEGEHLTVEFNTGHKVFLLQSSELKLKRSQEEQTDIDHLAGNLWSKVAKLKKSQSFTITTPAAVAGVRGTAFISMILPDQGTSFCICEGEVEVTAGGVTDTFSGGFGTKIDMGKKPGPAFSNSGLINQRRRLSRKGGCFECHWDGAGDTSRLDQESNLRFIAPE